MAGGFSFASAAPATPPPAPPATPQPSPSAFSFAATPSGGAPSTSGPFHFAGPTGGGGGGLGRKVANAALAPLEAVDAVLGAPERAVEGFVGSKAPGVRQRLGNAAYEAFHPHDAATRGGNLERAQEAIHMGARAKGAGFLPGAENFVRDTATQTLLDPLTYLPFVGEGRLLERGALATARGVHNLLPPATKGVVQKTADFFRSNPEIDRALGNKGAPIYHGIYRSERGKLGAQANADARLLHANRAELARGEMALPIRSRLLQEAYDHGTDEMRADALRIAKDQKIPLNEHGAPATHHLAYDVRADYEPFTRTSNVERPADAPFTRSQKQPTTAGFEMERVGDAPETPLFDRVEKRLATGRNVVFERSVDKRILEELIQRNAAGEGVIHDPGRFSDLRASGQTQGTRLAGIPALQKLSDAYKAALFINPLPHMFNIARLAYLAGGARAVARGIAHFARGGPKGELRQRLEEHTGLPEYLGGAGPQFADRIPGTRALREFGQHKLSEFDAAMRAGYLEELDKTLGVGATHSAEEYAKGSEVSKSLGGYDETSPVVEAIRAAGGPFAQWRLGVVPRAVGRATLRNPERVERYARGMNTLNADSGQNIELGGPEEDAAKLASPPTGTARYLTSPSTIGAVPAGIIAAAQGRPVDVAKAGEDLARQYIPGAGIVEEMAGLSPYNEGGNRIENTALGLIGGYTKQAPLSRGQIVARAKATRQFDAAIKAALMRGDMRAVWETSMRKRAYLNGGR